MERRCRLIVVAIDFGTTFSTWGYSFKDDYDQNPTKITAKHWTGLQTALSMKGLNLTVPNIDNTFMS